VDPSPANNNNAGCPGNSTSQTACNCPIGKHYDISSANAFYELISIYLLYYEIK
jgi:hypothetical protein